MAQHQALKLKLQRPTFKSVVRQVIRNRIVFRNEPFFRDMMREELRRVMGEEFQRVFRYELERLIRPLLHQIQRPQVTVPATTSTSETRFKLRFVNAVTKPVYTGDMLVSENSSPIMLEVIDSSNGDQRVTFGPLSSVQVEILALRNEFVKEEWGEFEFSNNILHQRNGKAPLLAGDVHVTLREGLGLISNVTFTDVSSRSDGGKFRLGARVVCGLASLDEKVKEAKSGAFVVKCSRLRDNDKHNPPKPDSEVWRLNHIAKNGCFHKGLQNHSINNVKEFLRLYTINPTELWEIFNKSGTIKEKTWRKIVSHALDCKLDDKDQYVFHGSPNPFGLLFDSIYNVVAILFDNSRVVSLDHLDPSQQELVNQLKLQAYKNTDNLVPFGPSRPLPSSDQTGGLISYDNPSFVATFDQSVTKYIHHSVIQPSDYIGNSIPVSSSSRGPFEWVNISVPSASTSYAVEVENTYHDTGNMDVTSVQTLDIETFLENISQNIFP